MESCEDCPGSKAWTDDALVRRGLLVDWRTESGVPPMPTPSVPNLTQMPENDPIEFDDGLVAFHMQAGLVDKTWILVWILVSLALPSVSFSRVAPLRRPSRGFGVFTLPRASWAPLGWVVRGVSFLSRVPDWFVPCRPEFGTLPCWKLQRSLRVSCAGWPCTVQIYLCRPP